MFDTRREAIEFVACCLLAGVATFLLTCWWALCDVPGGLLQ